MAPASHFIGNQSEGGSGLCDLESPALLNQLEVVLQRTIIPFSMRPSFLFMYI